MEELKKRRSIIKGTVTRFAKSLESSHAIADIAILKMKLEKIEPLYEKYQEIQTEIEILGDSDLTVNASHSIERDAFESAYFQSVRDAREIIGRTETVSSDGVRSTSRQTEEILPSIGIHLPKIILPTFDGAYGGWLKFRDTFESLIHGNRSLSSIQKFHYLNASLSGDKAAAIEQLGVSESNYPLAWETIRSRYEDTNTLIHHHVRGLFEATKVNRDSYPDVRQLIDQVNNHIAALKALCEKIDD